MFDWGQRAYGAIALDSVALMSVPTYDQFVEPLLRALSAHQDGVRSAEAYELVAKAVGLTEADKSELLPSGRQAVYKNRIGWAHDRLKRAGLSRSPKRGLWRLTPNGFAFADQHKAGLSPEELEKLVRVPADSKVIDGPAVAPSSSPKPDATVINASPDERIDEAVSELRDSVAAELLDLILDGSPTFFENLVLDVLHALGYGLDRSSLQQVGKSGDGGIDGIISLDRLGLEKVYVQAKRWQNNVGRPEIQSFFGALAGHRASKGVFITSSSFTKEARGYATQVSDSLVLVDGARLAGLMIDHGVGVDHRTVRIPQVDSDYFEEA